MMHDAKVLILDELSASIDAESEQEIYENIRVMMKIKTVVVVTHQMSVARMMDKIAVFDQGALVQTGTHEKLLREGGKYADLFEVQAAQFAPSYKGVASLSSV